MVLKPNAALHPPGGELRQTLKKSKILTCKTISKVGNIARSAVKALVMPAHPWNLRVLRFYQFPYNP